MSTTPILRSDNGAVLLEAGLVLPIFLGLFLMCVEIPRLMAVKQRLSDVSRLNAELVARGGSAISRESATTLMKHVPYAVKPGQVRSTAQTIKRDVDRTKLVAGTAAVLAGSLAITKSRLTSGDIIARTLAVGYYRDLWKTYDYHRADTATDISLLLPAVFYRVWLGDSGRRSTLDGWYPIYMPSCEAEQQRPPTVVSRIFSLF